MLPGNGWPVSGSRTIVDEPEKSPCQPATVGDRGRDLHFAVGLARPLVAAEEEQLVAHHRSAGGDAELVALVYRLGRCKVILRVERLVAEVLVGGAVVRVGARLGDHRHHRRTLAIFGRERVAQHVHFLHRVDRRIQRHVVEPERAHVDAVNGVVGRAVASALDRDELIAAAVLRVLLEAAAGDPRRRGGDVQQRPPRHRQGLEHLFVDHRAYGGARRLQQRRGGRHRQRLLDRADREAQRRPYGFARPQHYALELCVVEARELDFYVIGSRPEARHGEAAFAVRDDHALQTCSRLRHRDGGAGERGLRAVSHDAHNRRRGRFLGTRTGRDADQHHKSESDEPMQHSIPPGTRQTEPSTRASAVVG